MNIYLMSFFIAALFFVLTLKCLADRKLEFRYVFFWMVISVLLMWLCLSPTLLDRLAALLGVHYAPALLFAAGLAFVLALIFYVTVFISNITKRVVRLTQEVGMLKQTIQNLQQRSEEGDE